MAQSTASSSHPYPWSNKLWSYKKVGWLWPTASVLLIAPFRRIRDEYAQAILDTVQTRHAEAFECLRLARWGHSTGLRVTCPRCGKRAWSYSAKNPIRRWRCVTSAMYIKHERKKGYRTSGTSRQGCGLQFSDTKGTPFEQTPALLGLVFLSLYVPVQRIDQLLLNGGAGPTAVVLAETLLALKRKRHRKLAKRMRQFAKLFCGRIFLEHHEMCVSPPSCVLILEKLLSDARGLHYTAVTRKNALGSLNLQYKQVFALLAKLQRMQCAYLRGRWVDFPRGNQIYDQLTKAISALAPNRDFSDSE